MITFIYYPNAEERKATGSSLAWCAANEKPLAVAHAYQPSILNTGVNPFHCCAIVVRIIVALPLAPFAGRFV
jgi:hypothetical protein